MSPKATTRPAAGKMIGTREAAKIARVAQNTINYWIRTRRMRATPTARGYRFPASELYRELRRRDREARE